MTNPAPTTIIRLTVVSGPDAGMSRSFRKGRVSIGRGGTNDFPLNDGFISNFHGELMGGPHGGLIYRDLRSRHGSLVSVEGVSFHLHDKDEVSEIEIGHGAELQLGCTLMQLETREARALPAAIGQTPADGTPLRETLITSSHQSVQALGDEISSTSDERMAVILRLAGTLNGLTELDDIFERIVDATLEAFPGANFFALTLADSEQDWEQSEPFLTRQRTDRGLDSSEEASRPVISRSILKRVVETRESVLFVKDSLGSDVSQSIIEAKITACLCAPLVGQRSLLGVMEIDTRGQGTLFSKSDLETFNMLASLAAFALERAQLTRDIFDQFESFVYASVAAIESRDPATSGHSERVARYTLELAEAVNARDDAPFTDWALEPEEMTELRYAALLHDFGKIGVREAVIQKDKRLSDLHLALIHQRVETIKALTFRALTAEGEPDGIEENWTRTCDELDTVSATIQRAACAPWLSDEAVAEIEAIGERTYRDALGHERPFLTPHEIENLTIRRGTLNEEEWDDMRAHASYSEDYLRRISWSEDLQLIPRIAALHHEKLDGSGYPYGVSGDEIPTQVRMLTIADIFDALTASDRAYRKASGVDRACAILREEAADHKLDHALVELFISAVVPRVMHMIPSLRGESTDGLSSTSQDSGELNLVDETVEARIDSLERASVSDGATP